VSPMHLRSCLALSASLAVLVLARASFAQVPVVRVDLDVNGVEANAGADYVVISRDGRYVAFASDSSNLVPSDTNGAADIFVKELATGAIVRMSVDSSGAEADKFSYGPAISADGRFVAFISGADNLVANDTNAHFDVFVHDRDPDGNGVFDEGNDVTTRASVDSNGAQGNDDSGFGYGANGGRLSLSGDGRFVTFDSRATNLAANSAHCCFLHDNVTGATLRVGLDSAGNPGNAPSFLPVISRDGNFVAFTSDANNLVPGDHNGHADIFVTDLTQGTTTRASVSSAGVGGGGGDSFFPAISKDGRYVAFISGAKNLVTGDIDSIWNVFLRDTVNLTTIRVDVDPSGNPANENAWTGVALSDDGSQVVFESLATNLDPRDTNGFGDTFVSDLGTGATSLVSLTCFGRSADGNSSDWPFPPSITADGRFVAFQSNADDFVKGDTNGLSDDFVCDRTLAWPAASWTNYGAGFAGTLGVPSLVASADPRFGATSSVDASNSAGAATSGLLVVGTQRVSLPTRAGGTLLASPDFLIPEAIPAAGASIAFTVPFDVEWCGLVLDLQMLELDPGATHGIAFTAGLELVVGD